MKYALVQGKSSLIIKIANTVEELLQLDFQFDPSTHIPRIHRIDDTFCRDETGAALVAEIERQTTLREFKTMRVPH